MVEKSFQTNMFLVFLRNLSTVLEYLTVIGSWFQIDGAATGKANLAIFSFVLDRKHRLEMDDLRVREISKYYYTSSVPTVRNLNTYSNRVTNYASCQAGKTRAFSIKTCFHMA